MGLRIAALTVDVGGVRRSLVVGGSKTGRIYAFGAEGSEPVPLADSTTKLLFTSAVIEASPIAYPRPDGSDDLIIGGENGLHYNNVQTAAAKGGGPKPGRPLASPEIPREETDVLQEEFLRKPEVDVARNIKGQEEGSVARKIALADSTRTPPPDYYLCLQVYMRGIGEQTPLIHSLCSWWSQFRSVPHGAPGAEIFCNQIRKPLQCFRFRNDPFLTAPRLNDFTKQCVTDCLGKIDEGKRGAYLLGSAVYLVEPNLGQRVM